MIRSFTLILGLMPAAGFAQVFDKITPIAVPVGENAMEPAIFAASDNRLHMSWTEPDGAGFAVKTATLTQDIWSNPTTAVTSNSLFVNWADFPTVAAFDDGTLAVSWLQENEKLSYAYDISIALSSDDGQTWGAPLTPHMDRSARQHGFLTLLPTGPDALVAVWLDARDYNSQSLEDSFDNAMQLRSTTITKDGTLGADVALDVRTCTCCQTSAAMADDGTVLVAYRDRTSAEIRDIYIVRRQDGVWSAPAPVHNDGWEISGCPVNGPSIAANGSDAVVAWFTAADNTPAVNVAFSDDRGATFGTAFRVDEGDTVGRVNAVMLPDGDAIVTWVDWTADGEKLMVCRATRDAGCTARQTVATHNAGGSYNFPKLARSGNSVYLAWTQPLDGDTVINTVRMVRMD